jgi:hypothetical protein
MQMRVISHWLRNIMGPAACVRLPPGVPGDSIPLIGEMWMWTISHWLKNILAGLVIRNDFSGSNFWATLNHFFTQGCPYVLISSQIYIRI